MNTSNEYQLGRAEMALELLGKWADDLQDGSEDVLAIVEQKIDELHKKIKYLQLKACKHCGNKARLKDDECPYCGNKN